MNKQKIKVILLIVFGLLLIIYMVNFFLSAERKLSANPFKLEKEIPGDYLSLFNSNAQKNLILASAVSFKLRGIIVDLIYNNTYDIEITRFVCKTDFNIKKNIRESYTKSKGLYPETETTYGGNDFKVSYNGTSKDIVSDVFLSLNGDSTHVYHKSDSVVCYSSQLRNGYVQFKPEGVYEISIEGKKKLFFLMKRSQLLSCF